MQQSLCFLRIKIFGMNMEDNKKVKKIAEGFRNALGFPQVLSKSGSELLFENDVFTALFRERFGIASDNKEAFNAAFRAVTEGEGNESAKINSVISSALLPLLVFYKLYIPQAGRYICLTINGETVKFTKSFFEVRNKVVGLPSCVDVALVSEDGETILFLESKLTEMFESSTNEKEYGKSYKSLYCGTAIEKALGNGGISVDKEATNLILRSEKPQYLEGIKQTISHLIGLVKGPQNADDQTDYIKVYERAKRLVYSPIIYSTSNLFIEQPDESSRYAALYEKVIGENGAVVLEAIENWIKAKNQNKSDKKIEIHPAVLTYQSFVNENPTWLDEKVKTFYGL